MTRMSKLLMGATVLVMGSASLAAAFPGGRERGEGPRGGQPMFLQMFDQLDADGDGKLTPEELEAMGPGKAFSEADADGDGQLSGDELTAFSDAREQQRKEMRQQMMLKRMDTNEDGQLSLDELQARGPGREEMFKSLDKDGDGVLTRTELQQARPMMKMRGHGDREDHGGRGHN